MPLVTLKCSAIDTGALRAYCIVSNKMLGWLCAIFVFLFCHNSIHRVPFSLPREVPIQRTEFLPESLNSYITQNARHLVTGQVMGQETPIISPSGRIFVFDVNGWLLEVDETHNSSSRVLFAGGRTLGAVFATESLIYACDVAKGLISIDISSNAITVLVTYAGGAPVLYCDDVDIDEEGVVYFTDAMKMAPVHRANGLWTTMELSLIDFFRGVGDGRLIRYDPRTRVSDVLLDKVYFANGVAVSTEGDFVLVAETFNLRILRYWLKGPRADTRELFALLPSVPDGLSRAPDGSGFWVASPTTVTWLFEIASKVPPLRYLVGNLPEFLWPKSRKTGIIYKLLNSGDIGMVLHDVDGTNVNFISAVEQYGDRLYLGQLHGNSVPVLPVPAASYSPTHQPVAPKEWKDEL